MTTPPTPPPKALQQYCESALAILNSQYRATQVLRHNGTVGAIREQIIKDFLAAHLPELVTVVSGQIVDSHNNYSKQQDVVLVLKSTARLPFASGLDLIFLEGVVAAIEIKTTLNTSELNQIGENFKTVRQLRPAIGSTGQLGVNHSWPNDRILTAIICYGGMSADSMMESLDALEESARPDIVLDLSRGMIVQNHGLLWIQQPPPARYITFQNAADGFKVFLTFLTEITGTVSGRGVLWRNYW